MNITFIHTEWLIPLICLIAVTLLLLVRGLILRHRRLLPCRALKKASTSASIESFRSFALFLALMSSGVVALGPIGLRKVSFSEYEGLEVTASIDCSKSMLAPAGSHLWKSRIVLSVDAVENVFQQLTLDKRAIACFSGKVNSVSPQTTDYDRLIKPKLEELRDVNFVTSIGNGTNFAAALEGCERTFHFDRPSKKVCIILSDGEPQGNVGDEILQLDKKIAELKSRLQKNNLTSAFYLVEVGDSSQPMKIPTYDGAGNPQGFLCCNDAGNPIETRPDSRYLESIASSLGGKFIEFHEHDSLERILADLINSERKVMSVKEETVRDDLSFWWIVIISASLCTFLFIPKRINMPQRLRRNKNSAS